MGTESPEEVSFTSSGHRKRDTPLHIFQDDPTSSKKQRMDNMHGNGLDLVDQGWRQRLKCAAKKASVRMNEGKHLVGSSAVKVHSPLNGPALLPETTSQLPFHYNATSPDNTDFQATHPYIPQIPQVWQHLVNTHPQMSTSASGAYPSPGPVPLSAPSFFAQQTNRFLGASVFYALPSYDYDFSAILQDHPHPVNFTAVEIIVFLPHLFFNEMIARRFVNNKLMTSEQAYILKRFRNIDIANTALSKHYRKALLPYQMKDGVEVRKATGWERANHSVPIDWDRSRIDINGFVPDRILRNRTAVPPPEDVPFADLIKGVTHLPEAEDAADLTHAIRFACFETEKAEELLKHPPMFPTDLPDILRHIGHVPISERHRDSLVQRRYKAEKKKHAEGPHAMPSPALTATDGGSALEDTPDPETPVNLEGLIDPNLDRALAEAEGLSRRNVTENDQPQRHGSDHQQQDNKTHVQTQDSEANEQPLEFDAEFNHQEENPEANNQQQEDELDYHLWDPEGTEGWMSDADFKAMTEKYGGKVEPRAFTAEDYEDLFGEPAPERLKRTDENAP